jgi:hypothetical protein
MLSAMFLAATLVFQFEPTWTALGSRVVSDSTDHDTIVISAAQGTYRSVKITVQRSQVRLDRLVLSFENGQRRELNLHELLPAGGETRIIHLKGPEQAIRGVDFWYDPKTVGRRGAVVLLVGREGKP